VRRGAACAAHSNTVRHPSGVVVPKASGRPPCLWSPCPHSRSASACPVSARPVSGVRCVSSIHLSAGRPPGVRVQCPVSDGGCPVSGASVRHRCVLRPHPRCPRRCVLGACGQPQASVPAAAGVSPHRVRDRLVGCQSPTLAPAAAAGVAGAAADSLGAVVADAWAVAWLDRLATKEQPVARKGRPSVGQPVRVRLAHLPQAARSSAGAGCRRAADHDLVVGRPRREALGPTARRLRGPTAAQGGARPARKRSDRE
jgi:hypothetical protein